MNRVEAARKTQLEQARAAAVSELNQSPSATDLFKADQAKYDDLRQQNRADRVAENMNYGKAEHTV